VLLHGITSTSDAWREVMPRLAERYTVIAADMIGHGRSAKPMRGVRANPCRDDHRWRRRVMDKPQRKGW
jgi:pimeloyl-ACP methyl ester carboxylesterase